MARIRSVSPDICTDQGLVGLSGDAERLYVRLWTHLDDDGRCEDDLLLLKAALFPRHRHIGEDDIERWLLELIANGQLFRYEAEGKRCLTVRPEPWAKYQKPRRHIDSRLPAPSCTDIVGTRSDTVGQRPAGVGGGEGDGGEMDKEKEGESEGEPDTQALRPQTGDNPVTTSLLGKLDRVQAVHAEHMTCPTEDDGTSGAPASPLRLVGHNPQGATTGSVA